MCAPTMVAVVRRFLCLRRGEKRTREVLRCSLGYPGCGCCLCCSRSCSWPRRWAAACRIVRPTGRKQPDQRHAQLPVWRGVPAPQHLRGRGRQGHDPADHGRGPHLAQRLVMPKDQNAPFTLVTPVQRNDVALITLSRVGPGRVRKEVRDFGVILEASSLSSTSRERCLALVTHRREWRTSRVLPRPYLRCPARGQRSDCSRPAQFRSNRGS